MTVNFGIENTIFLNDSFFYAVSIFLVSLVFSFNALLPFRRTEEWLEGRGKVCDVSVLFFSAKHLFQYNFFKYKCFNVNVLFSMPIIFLMPKIPVTVPHILYV